MCQLTFHGHYLVTFFCLICESGWSLYIHILIKLYWSTNHIHYKLYGLENVHRLATSLLLACRYRIRAWAALRNPLMLLWQVPVRYLKDHRFHPSVFLTFHVHGTKQELSLLQLDIVHEIPPQCWAVVVSSSSLLLSVTSAASHSSSFLLVRGH